MVVSIIYGNVFEEKHKPWYPHPEHPARIRRAIKGILRAGLRNKVEWLPPIRANVDVLYGVHVKGYVDYVLDLVNKAPTEIDSDTYIAEDSLEAILYAVGTSTFYAEKSLENKIFFGLIRPPGHHVGKGGKAMGASTQGFCIFNNIALAAQTLIERGVDKILILDFDAHHGNGTQEIFYDTDRVLHIDIHQDPYSLYPGTGYPEQIGKGRGAGYTINFLLPPMAGDDVLDDILSCIYDILKQYDPEVILVSAGFDGYNGDGFTELRYSTNTFHTIGKMLASTNRPLLILLEGGYTTGLERGLPAFVAGLIGEKNPFPEKRTTTLPVIKNSAREYFSKTINLISKYWKIR